MTKYLLSIQAGLIALQGYVPQLNVLEPWHQTIILVVTGISLAMLGPLLPKVSLVARRVLDLQRRG